MVTKAFPLWWNVVDHPQVTHWRLCRAIWQQSGHHFDAIIFSILDFWSLLSFGHWRAHSPNRAIAVRQLDSLNRSFALYLPKRAAQGNEKTCKLPMLASLLQIKKHGRNSSNLVNHISFCKKKVDLTDLSSYQVFSRGWFFPASAAEGLWQLLHAVALPAVPENLIGQQMLRNRITQFPMRWQKALLSYDKTYKNAFQLPNHSNPIQQLRECWSQRHQDQDQNQASLWTSCAGNASSCVSLTIKARAPEPICCRWNQRGQISKNG